MFRRSILSAGFHVNCPLQFQIIAPKIWRGGSSESPLSAPEGGVQAHLALPVHPADVALAGSPPSSSGKPTDYDQINMQSEQDRFLKNSGKKKSSEILENAVVSPISPFEILARGRSSMLSS